MNLPTQCPKCTGAMEEGFILDAADTPWVARWIEGPPQVSRWFGAKLKGRRQSQIQTFRCVRCNYLESYAREK